MKSLYFTGGVGSGKSAVLSYIREKYKSHIILSDDLAKDMMIPGGICYEQLKDAFKDDGIFDDKGEIIKEKMAALIYSSEKKRLLVNSIVHPAVERYIIDTIVSERSKKEIDVFIVEAAIVLKGEMAKYIDEYVYLYADREVRIDRLSTGRGYSREKSLSIINGQISDDEYKKNCTRIIDNSSNLYDTKKQIDKMFEDFGIKAL